MAQTEEKKSLNVEVKTTSIDKLKKIQGYLSMKDQPSTQADAIEMLIEKFKLPRT